jgi:hypothetical protein
MNWCFELVDDVVRLDARLEDEDGRIGDARAEVGEGEEFFGVSYDELRAAGDGIVKVGEDGNGKIVDTEIKDSD